MMTQKRECDHCHAQIDDLHSIVKEWRTVGFGGNTFDVCPKCSKELKQWLGIDPAITAATPDKGE